MCWGHGRVLTGASVRQVTVWKKWEQSDRFYPTYHGQAVRIPAGLNPDAAGGARPRVVRYVATYVAGEYPEYDVRSGGPRTYP